MSIMSINDLKDRITLQSKIIEGQTNIMQDLLAQITKRENELENQSELNYKSRRGLLEQISMLETRLEDSTAANLSLLDNKQILDDELKAESEFNHNLRLKLTDLKKKRGCKCQKNQYQGTH